MKFSVLTLAAALFLGLSQATPIPEDESRLGTSNCYAAKSNGVKNPSIKTLPPAGGMNPDAWCVSTCMLYNATPDSDACRSSLEKYCEGY